jgi:hypothetical protein
MRGFNFKMLSLLLALTFSVAGGSAWPQTQASPNTGSGASATRAPSDKASAPAPTQSRKSPAWWGSDVTPGWGMMSWKERNEHRKKMRTMTHYVDCKAYQREHHEKMAARAKEKGQLTLPDAKRDGCANLKP